jgi:YVTN family beta-propeller protein
MKIMNSTKIFVLGLLSVILMLVNIAGAVQTNAYISNSGDNTVSIIDTAINTVTATVQVGTNPSGVALAPNGETVYIGNIGDNTVSIIDTATNTVTATVQVGNTPSGIAVSPDGTKVYVASYTDGTVSIIDTTNNNAVTATVQIGTIGTKPTGVAVTPDGTKVYVANAGDNTVYVIDTTNNNAVTTVGTVGAVGVGNQPFGIAVGPGGTKVYVANNGDNTVSVIDTTNNNAVTTVGVGNQPYSVAVTPDGTKVYVANNGDNTVSVIDTTNNNAVTSVGVGNQPFGIAITPNGEYAYVANSVDNTVSIIDTTKNTVTATVQVGKSPMAVGQFIGNIPIPGWADKEYPPNGPIVVNTGGIGILVDPLIYDTQLLYPGTTAEATTHVTNTNSNQENLLVSLESASSTNQLGAQTTGIVWIEPKAAGTETAPSSTDYALTATGLVQGGTPATVLLIDSTTNLLPTAIGTMILPANAVYTVHYKLTLNPAAPTSVEKSNLHVVTSLTGSQ